MGKSDRMEYVAVYNASQTTSNPLQIDLNYYMEGAIMGLLARFVAYKPEFAQQVAAVVGTDDLDDHDAKIIKLANSYIEQLCNRFSGVDSTLSNKTGLRYRQLARAAAKSASAKLAETNPGAGHIIAQIGANELSSIDSDEIDIADAVERIVAYAKSLARVDQAIALEMNHEYVKRFRGDCARDESYLRVMRDLYKLSINNRGFVSYNSRIGEHDKLIIDKTNAIATLMPNVIEGTRLYKNAVAELILHARNAFTSGGDPSNIPVDIPAQAVVVFEQLYARAYELAGLYAMRDNIIRITHAINDEYCRIMKTQSQPLSIPEPGKSIADTIPKF